ncbi:COG4315 family predicted lipoprotein [Kitasatospora azatica]|uniref:COG4315 family predicted lipoprotein n=1 Tax=Kitasatospora azatica TaxID=58347 RepID=UPI00055A654D|nr:hypothetical protein [Kitasatospora azatica]
MGQARLAATSVAAVALLVAVCGGCSSSTKTSTAASSSPSAAASASGYATGGASASASVTGAGAVISVAAAGKFPGILVDSAGWTLYLFEKDTSATSTCTDACAASWPPVTTTDAPTAGSGADQALLSTSVRPDGRTQVVYNGHPLYRFTGDATKGDTSGEGSTAFGAKWFVVDAKGNKVEGS